MIDVITSYMVFNSYLNILYNYMEQIINLIKRESKRHSLIIDQSANCKCCRNKMFLSCEEDCKYNQIIGLSYNMLKLYIEEQFKHWLKLDETKNITGTQLKQITCDNYTYQYLKHLNFIALYKYHNSIKLNCGEIITLIIYYQYQLHRANINNQLDITSQNQLDNIKRHLQEKYPQYINNIDNSLNDSMEDPFNSDIHLEDLDFIEDTIIIQSVSL